MARDLYLLSDPAARSQIRYNRHGLLWLLDKLDHGDRSVCWDWPFGGDRRGYGRLMFMYRTDRAHRVSWMLTHQRTPPKDRKQVIRHHCDNPRCCNPDHLELGTQSQNIQEAHDRGLTSPRRGEQTNSPLSDADVREIRRRQAEGETQTKLAGEFGVSQPAVSYIINRRTWTHLGIPESSA